MDLIERILFYLERSPTLAITVACLLVFVSIITLLVFKSRPSGKKNVLLVGISGSGKTTVFCQLVFKTSNPLTQISITPNVGIATLEKANKEKSFDLVDVPGQDKIRRKFVDMYKRTAKGLVFVVDSSTFHKESKDVAQFLFDLLTDEAFAKSTVKLLVACNKQDIEFAKAENFIKSTLEKEIELLRKMSSSALKSTDNKSSNKSSLQLYDVEKPFDFSLLKNFRVEFCETSSLKSDTLVPLKNWFLANL